MGAAIEVDTRQVTRRDLHFERIDDLLTDIESLGAGQPDTTGNWSAPQILDHVTRVIDASMDGFVGKAPFFLRALAPLMKKRILTKPMAARIKIPSAKQGRTPPDDRVGGDDAVKHLHESVERFREQNRMAPSPLLGAMSHNEWEQLHCRHAEMHFSFLKARQ